MNLIQISIFNVLIVYINARLWYIQK